MDPKQNQPSQPALYPPAQYYAQPVYQPQPPQGYPVGAAPVQYAPPQPMFYQAPQQAYVVAPENAPANTPLLGGQPPFHHHGTTKERLLAREYEVTIGKWVNEAWTLYCDNWVVLTLFTLLVLVVSSIPYVGFLFSFPMVYGFFISGSHFLRNVPTGHPHIHSAALFHGFYYYFPLLIIGLLYSLAVSFGLFLLIIPGIYFMVTLYAAPMIYLEYRHEGIGILDSMEISRKVIQKHFCANFLLLIVICLLVSFGIILFFVGALITIPVAYMVHVFAFRDIFGLSQGKQLDRSCVSIC